MGGGSRGSISISLAAAAGILALTCVAWVYGVYCYVQMVRHRRPGVPLYSVVWPSESLTDRGLLYRRRALSSYAVFALLAVLLMIVEQLSHS